MIKIKCYSNDEVLDEQEWPLALECRPIVGDLILSTGEYEYIGQIIQIMHRSFKGCPMLLVKIQPYNEEE